MVLGDRTIRNGKSQWQPIGEMPVFAERLQALDNETTRQYGHLNWAVESNYFESFDADTLERINNVYREQLNDHWLLEEQLARWKRESLSDADNQMVDDLINQSKSLKWFSQQILTHVETIATTAIVNVLNMDEAESALRVLTDEIKLPR